MKLHHLALLLSSMVLSLGAQAQVVRCVNPSTGLVTYTNARQGCPNQNTREEVKLHYTSGAQPGSSTASGVVSASRVSVIASQAASATPERRVIRRRCRAR